MDYSLFPEVFMSLQLGYNEDGQLRSFFEQECSPQVTSTQPQVVIAVPERVRCGMNHICKIVIPLCLSYVVKSGEERSILEPMLQVSWIGQGDELTSFNIHMTGDSVRGSKIVMNSENRPLTLTGGWVTYNLTDFFHWPDRPNLYTCTFKLVAGELQSEVVSMVLEIY